MAGEGEGICVVKVGGSRSFVSSASSDTVAGVKAKIAQESGVAVAQQRLLFEGRELEDSETLAALTGDSPEAERPTLYLLQRGSASEVPPVQPPPSGFRGVRVSFIGGGKGIDVEAEPTDTVESLKAKLGEQLGADHELRLIFLGEELVDAAPLGAQGVHTPSAPTLHALLEKLPTDEAEQHQETTSSDPMGCRGLVERRIDGVWFLAKITRVRLLQGAPNSVDIRYSEPREEVSRVSRAPSTSRSADEVSVIG